MNKSIIIQLHKYNHCIIVKPWWNTIRKQYIFFLHSLMVDSPVITAQTNTARYFSSYMLVWWEHYKCFETSVRTDFTKVTFWYFFMKAVHLYNDGQTVMKLKVLLQIMFYQFFISFSTFWITRNILINLYNYTITTYILIIICPFLNVQKTDDYAIKLYPRPYDNLS